MLELNKLYCMGKKNTYKMTYRNGHNIREHRAVMEEYLKRPLSANEIVHHKDGNKRNNDICNLEIMTRSTHAKIHDANLLKRRRPVIQEKKDGSIVKIWSSAFQVKKELGYANANIAKCCKHLIKSSYGFVWRYADVGNE